MWHGHRLTSVRVVRHASVDKPAGRAGLAVFALRIHALLSRHHRPGTRVAAAKTQEATIIVDDYRRRAFAAWLVLFHSQGAIV